MSTIVCTFGGFLAGGDSQLQSALTFRLIAAEKNFAPLCPT